MTIVDSKMISYFDYVLVIKAFLFKFHYGSTFLRKFCITSVTAKRIHGSKHLILVLRSSQGRPQRGKDYWLGEYKPCMHEHVRNNGGQFSARGARIFCGWSAPFLAALQATERKEKQNDDKPIPTNFRSAPISHRSRLQ